MPTITEPLLRCGAVRSGAPAPASGQTSPHDADAKAAATDATTLRAVGDATSACRAPSGAQAGTEAP